MGSDPPMGWWLGLAPATLEFWVRFPNERNQGKQAHPVLKYLVPHGSQTCFPGVHGAGRKKEKEGSSAAQPPPPGGWPAGSTSPSSPQGLETRSRKRTRTDSALSPSWLRNPEGHPPRHSRQLPRARLQHLQGLAPRHFFFFNPGPVWRVPIPNRYTAKAKLCFCKNNKRRIIITDRRQTCLYVVHWCQGLPTLRNRLGCLCRVLHRSRPVSKVDDEDAGAGHPSPHQKSAFLHHLGRQH
jgi:hypothetical protein